MTLAPEIRSLLDWGSSLDKIVRRAPVARAPPGDP